jgi:hypothetical protein
VFGWGVILDRMAPFQFFRMKWFRFLFGRENRVTPFLFDVLTETQAHNAHLLFAVLTETQAHNTKYTAHLLTH